MDDKAFIIASLKSLNVKNLSIFKTKWAHDYSLTEHGYLLISNNKLYAESFIAKLDKGTEQLASTLILIKKIFNKSPYYIKGRYVFYFDGIIHAEISMYGGLSGYVEHQRSVEKFNRS